ncbi:hypothetical protein CVT24_004986 [Panaeolus cyanescens]|uniref:Chromo domain-containing protein n=1 Tax=Panaeolus cyanescens TaxID=181874 RepID=A0A409V9N2_9AGAR|nr:hypothetical protein CVT24_004986 [Panaeolus cyanescens]
MRQETPTLYTDRGQPARKCRRPSNCTASPISISSSAPTDFFSISDDDQSDSEYTRPKKRTRRVSPESVTSIASDTSSTPSHTSAPSTITICGVDLRSSVAFDTFWRFAAERKAIDDRRRAGESGPWTKDPILQRYFFCNTYRILDKVTQYLVANVIEKGPKSIKEVVFRVILFNLFTKIETWELLERELGPLTWASYNRENYERVLTAAFDDGMKLYTGAFIKPAPHFHYKQNYMNHLCLMEVLMENDFPSRLSKAAYAADVFEYLVSFPSMGDFSAYQLMLGLSYTDLWIWHPNDFVVSGPGSISGLNKIFGADRMNLGRRTVDDFDAEVMRYMANTQAEHFQRLKLDFSGLGPKRLPMDLSDIEHTLCEVDKYCRVAHPRLKGKRTNISRNFRPHNPKAQEPIVLPKAWNKLKRKTPRIRPERKLTVEKRYMIDFIAAHEDRPEDGRVYFVHWVGYPPSDATWEFEESLLQDAPQSVKEYLKSLKSQ